MSKAKFEKFVKDFRSSNMTPLRKLADDGVSSDHFQKSKTKTNIKTKTNEGI
jgi:hypothetical protein